MAGAGAAGDSPAAGGDDPGAPAPAAAPGPGTPGWRDWAAGLPGPVLARVAEKLAAQLAPRRSRGLTLMLVTCKPWKEAMKKEAIARAGGPEVWRDWGNRFGEGLPTRVLVKVAEKYIALAEQRYAADLERQFSWGQRHTQYMLNKRRADGNCLYPFARVGKGWRKAQRQVGGRLRTRLKSDIVSPGRVELVRWALAEGCPRERALMAYVGAERGHVQVVQWVVEELDFNPDRHLMSRAAIGGKLELVQWLRARGCPWDAAACAQAAEGGSFEVLQWLRAQGCPWNDKTCAEAARHARVELLLWARKNGCEWSAWTATCAAMRGHLHVLKLLRARGCPWDHRACEYAVENHHLEVLRWARENGCPWVAADRDRAASQLGYTDDFGNVV